jgi:IS30 family transposase
MEGMRLPKSYMILGKHPNSIYREINRNGINGVYTGNQAQAMSVQRRVDTKPSPTLDDPGLTWEIMGSFKQDLSPDQIADRLRVRELFRN